MTTETQLYRYKHLVEAAQHTGDNELELMRKFDPYLDVFDFHPEETEVFVKDIFDDGKKLHTGGYIVRDWHKRVRVIAQEEFERDYEPVTVDGWRDISEAPLDRSTVLLTGFIYINGTRTTERWVCAAKFVDNNWFALEEIATDTWEELFNPTHFMPLPLPPAPKATGVEE